MKDHSYLMSDKKKRLWIILTIVAALGIGLAMYFWLRPTVFHAEIIDPRTLHASPTHANIIVGLWQKDNHLYYRFNDDGTGHTWDEADDVSETEASPFQWKAYEEAIMITHEMILRGVVPRYYKLDQLNAYDLRFHDAYSAYALERVEEDVVSLGDGDDLE
jgi:hypothetical protein